MQNLQEAIFASLLSKMILSIIQNAFYSLNEEKVSIMKNIWKIVSDQGCGYICPAKLYHKLDDPFQHAIISPLLK